MIKLKHKQIIIMINNIFIMKINVVNIILIMILIHIIKKNIKNIKTANSIKLKRTHTNKTA